jgi:hypothetical protein
MAWRCGDGAADAGDRHVRCARAPCLRRRDPLANAIEMMNRIGRGGTTCAITKLDG